MQPIILTEGQYDSGDVNTLQSQAVQFRDIYVSQLTELFEINNAFLIKTDKYDQKLNDYLKEMQDDSAMARGNYVYYPWRGLLLRMVDKEKLYQLRTNRTNNLITPEEQKVLASFTGGVAGLSFGNGIALSLVYSGASDTIKIADTDIFETTNLNRVRVGLPSVTLPKTQVTAQDIYEINPYANIEIYESGLSDDTLPLFFGGECSLNIVYDVVDDLAMKVKIRHYAKINKIPVVMLTSLEDSILVDVERYDLNPNADIFHGLLGDVTEDLLTKTMSEADKARYAMKIVSPENISFRNLSSLADIGTKLVSRPHLYGTVSIVCGLAAYITKRIALNEDMPSLRKLVKFNDIFEISPGHDDTQQARDAILAHMLGKS